MNTSQLILKKKEQKSIVLKIATKVGLHDPNDWSKFNQFMLHKSVHKKDLNLYDLEELKDLVKQFRGIDYHYEKSAKQKGTKAYYHKRWLTMPSNN